MQNYFTTNSRDVNLNFALENLNALYNNAYNEGREFAHRSGTGTTDHLHVAPARAAFWSV